VSIYIWTATWIIVSWFVLGIIVRLVQLRQKVIMARGIVVFITVSDTGHITIYVRGPVKGQEGMLEILHAAETLVKQGTYGQRG
jgi:hypothetical protein